MGKKSKSKGEPENFCPGGLSQQRHRQPLYSMTWSSDVHVGKDGIKYNYLATCGSRVVTIYEVESENSKGSFSFKQSYRDADPDEHFYTVAYGGRSKYWELQEPAVEDSEISSSDSEEEDNPGTRSARKTTDGQQSAGKKRPREDSDQSLLLDSEEAQGINYLEMDRCPETTDGPQLLCVAGAAMIIKIIDPVQKKQIGSLHGHGSDIYEMKVSPASEFLLLSASVDESIRLWNLSSLSCVAIFAGQHGHREAVLSVSWHATGNRFASSGMDKSIRLWSISNDKVKEALKASRKQDPKVTRKSFHPQCEQFPYFATKKVHLNYVDCVQFLGDMILSKSTYNSIILWTPKLPDGKDNLVAHSAAYLPPSDVVALRTFELDQCHIWFVRFTTDTLGRFLAVGNIKGEVDIWEIDACKKRPSQRLKPMVNSTIRMLAFSPNGKTLVACNDTGSVCKWNQP